MKSLGFNSFRIPISNQMLSITALTYGLKYVNYQLNPDLKGKTPLQILDAILNYCNNATVNMKVIVKTN